MMRFFRCGAFTAAIKSGLSQALMSPGRWMKGTLGNTSATSEMRGPLGPSEKLVEIIVGIPKIFPMWAKARTLFRNSGWLWFATPLHKPVWWSTRTSAELSGVNRESDLLSSDFIVSLLLFADEEFIAAAY